MIGAIARLKVLDVNFRPLEGPFPPVVTGTSGPAVGTR